MAGQKESFHKIVDGLGGEYKGQNTDGQEHAMCCCPAHDDKTPSLSVTLADKVLFNCFAGCTNEAVIDEFIKLDLWSGSSGSSGSSMHEVIFNEAEYDDKAKEFIADYLKNRNISTDSIPESLRFHYLLQKTVDDKKELFNGVVAKIQSFDGEFRAIQRIFLNKAFQKADVDSPKMMLGSPKGGHVLLNTGVNPEELHVAEGIETSLAIFSKLKEIQLVSAVSSENMKILELPKKLKKLYIWIDKDTPDNRGIAAGRDAAEKLGQRALLEDIEVWFVEPPSKIDENTKSVDWLDDIKYICDYKKYLEKYDGSPWAEAILPPKYALDENGLSLEITKKDGVIRNVYLSRKPFYFAGHYLDLETGTSKLELKYQAGEHSRSIFIDRALIYRSGWLATIADNFVLPIPAKSASDIGEYIFEADLICDKIRYVTKSSGFKTMPDGARAFPPFGGGIEIKPDGPGLEKRFKSFKASGDEKTWYKRIFETLLQNPIACLPFAAALGSPLLTLLGNDSAIIDVNYESGKGKSISCAMAMSIWGDPQGLKVSWDQTRIALEQNAIAFNNLPLWFDETGANQSPKEVGAAAYNIGNEVGRERGAKDGGTRLTGTWKLYLISTGEKSILSFAPTRWAGQDARVIPVTGMPLSGFNRAQANSLKNFVNENYGFLGPKFIRDLLEEDVEKLQKKSKSVTRSLVDFVYDGDDLQARKAETFATLIVAVDFLHTVLGRDYSDEIFVIEKALYDFWKDLCKSHVSTQRAHEAFDALMDYEKINSASFLKETRHNRAGTASKGNLGFIPAVWNEILTKAGFAPDNILGEFWTRGWLVPGPHNRKDVQTSILGTKHRLYTLSAAAIKQYRAGWNLTTGDGITKDEAGNTYDQHDRSIIAGEDQVSYEDRHNFTKPDDDYFDPDDED